MHQLAGLTLGEWVSIIGIVTFLAGVVSLLFKYAVFAPFQMDIRELNSNFKTLNQNLASLQSDLKEIEIRVDGHDRRLDRHDERLKNIGKEVFK
ncbi:hypothetical protein RD055328_08240 [Companilactobacillus sp. RD055328]|uniref:hypothetical protein n=1 Tax=Companilactobacillus sp. RD055328 TaxID=2916634 RepID=UPI001FC7F4BA|nr:hypothetical protein [Companilactobacillus sp. RD055328]GKQ42901.1 hypothetical protein RD055328_08240 [Companilactobacillus sp. RD055328]